MPKTVLITGSSSGIGHATALYFAENGWNVIATMRDPGKNNGLGERKNIDVVRLDVTDQASIEKAVKYALDKFGAIDALVNNAGYSVKGVFEATTHDQAKRQLDTNVLGLMDMTRAVIPSMRSKGEGVIVNISSIGGRVAVPLYSLYQSSKFAVEGFSESLYYEMRTQNIKVKLVEPGVIKSDFYTRSMDRVDSNGLHSYASIIKASDEGDDSIAAKGSNPDVIAVCIFNSVNDGSWRLRYHAGKYSSMILTLRKILPDRLLMRVLRR
ncbi:MAG: short chain dehydrogenase [Methanomassiliicoccales archaeon PtaU1.Bin124]|nr:MAG: short chain dehydrogenase [Methanomassiliicoccales archaeon PtaU1.Bin124]